MRGDLEVETRRMTDADIRRAIQSIRGNPKRAGYRARLLTPAEVEALAALMAEKERRRRD